MRSPGEFAQGHIPNSINLPLFTDQEKSVVGTVYKKQGSEIAIQLGFEIAKPKLDFFAQQARKYAGASMAKIYCWRGGLRSSSMAHFFQSIGLQVCTLRKGYKTFRHWVLKSLNLSRSIALIGGLTGCGKTELLCKLASAGHQTLDLEALAKHRGSSYGMIPLSQQPSNEQYENEIALHLQTLDRNQPLWIEDESRMIGKCKIPDALYKQMRAAPLFVIESSKQKRVNRLMQDYGTASHSYLMDATKRIERKLGSQRTFQVINHLQSQNLEKAIEIVLDYYDKLYMTSLNCRQQPIFYLSNLSNAMKSWEEELCMTYHEVKNKVL